MKHATALALILALSTWCLGQTPDARSAKTEVSEHNPNPLPKYMTPEEQKLPPLPVERDGRTPPTGVVYCPPEYDPQAGLFIAWEGYESVLTELTVGITTGDPDAIVWCVVDSSSEQSSAYSTLNSAGANMDQVEFMIRTTDTVWIRDYGPRFIFEDGQRAVIDHTYNRPRPYDNLLNDYISQQWGESQYQIPLTHGGGNFHLFANGDAFMTTLVLSENSGMSEQDVIDLFADYQNVNLTIYTGFPTSFDSTQHIDMWMLPVDDYKIIIGEYSSGTGQPYTITENAVTDLESRGYTVYRTPGWSSGGTHYTYTNAVILNDQVFVPRFGGSWTSQDAEALSVFAAAFPDHTLHQVYCGSIIYAAGAVHCIVMHVPEYAPDPIPVARVIAPNGGEVWTVGQEYDIRWTASDDVEVTSVDLYLSTNGGGTFDHVIDSGLANTGTYAWTVPATTSAECRVKVVAHDGDGNSGDDVSDGDFIISLYGAQVIHDFPLDSDPEWSTTGLWDWGEPAGLGGQHGYTDPTSGYTNSFVYGYNLDGDYENSLSERHLTTSALDCSGVTGTKLAFWRWLGVEASTYDHAYVRVSNNGTAWITVWENSAQVIDSSWSYQEYDISAVADDQATVYVRWTMGETDGSWQFCGWNIDDIEIIGVPPEEPGCRGDCNCDGQVDFGDINPFVAALADPPEYCDGTGYNADVNGSGTVGFDDINPFVDLLTSGDLPIPCE